MLCLVRPYLNAHYTLDRFLNCESASTVVGVDALSEYYIVKRMYINVKMVKAPQCSERRMGGCLAVPGPEVGRCVRAGVRLLSSLSWGHIPSVATRHTPGLYRRLSSCTWQHNPLINLEVLPLVHTLIKHLLLIVSFLSLSSIPVNQSALCEQYCEGHAYFHINC